MMPRTILQPAEGPREKFERLVEQRLEKAEEAIRLVGNLANPNIYEFDAADKTEVFERLLLALEQAEKKFNATLRRQIRNTPPQEHSQVKTFRSEGQGR